MGTGGVDSGKMPQRLSPISHVPVTFTVLVSSLFLSLYAVPMSKHTDAGPMIRLCGENLVKMMKVVCNNCFDGTPLNLCICSLESETFKRATDENHLREQCLFRAIANKYMDETENTGLHKRKQKPAGIVDECCIRSCTYSYMRKFCCNSEAAATE
ncbi:unnamed protein product [Soboliphyme baturini]|uniref:IlGF domain-containing protein n=1 Tax=Soboliphyme baturini TaxID=241478 RepID=A0A183INX6_9BILA|nr:unnamed protein product [Soboliphyme baturini]